MQMIHLVAGLAWDPEIRGFLAVLTGVVVLMGSVWLLLSTNSGVRTGTLLAGAGLFGWFTIMGTIWWIYGIGYRGDPPSFELQEIVVADDSGHQFANAELDRAKHLRADELPTATELLVAEADRLAAETDFVQKIDGEYHVDIDGLNASGVKEYEEFALAWIDYGVLTADLLPPDEIAGLDDAAVQEVLAEENQRNAETTLSELAAVAPHLVPDFAQLDGWELTSTAEMGEAQASAIEFLLESPDFDFADQSEFKVLNGFAVGGERPLKEDPNRWDRIYHQIWTALAIKTPTKYAVIQMQAVDPATLDNLPGRAPQRTVVDPAAPVVSVIMVRNLGNLREPPALFAIGSAILFAAFAYMLHERDKVEMARRAEYATV